MRKVVRLLLQLVFVAIAITILYPHAQHIWGLHSVVGWRDAISQEWAGAWQPMLASIIILVAVIVMELWFVKQERREQHKRDTAFETIITTLQAIAKN